MYAIEHYLEIKRPALRCAVGDKVIVEYSSGGKFLGVISWIGRKFLNIEEVIDENGKRTSSEKYSIDNQKSDNPYKPKTFKTPEQEEYDNLLDDVTKLIKSSSVLPDGAVFAIGDLLKEYFDIMNGSSNG